DISAVSGLVVQPALAMPEDIEDALQRYYREDQENIQSIITGIGSNAAVAGDDAEDLLDVDGADDTSKDSAPIIRVASMIIQQAIKDHASDIHVEPARRD